MSRDKLRYALQYIDRAYRGRFLDREQDSALAYYHSPFALYRPFEDLTFHTVTRMDRSGRPSDRAKQTRSDRSARPRWRRVAGGIARPILQPVVRRTRRAPLRGRAETPDRPDQRSRVAAGGRRMSRHEFLAGLHAALAPRTYLEIGVNDGKSMALSNTTSIGVDPAFSITEPLHCDLTLVRATSDDFFAMADPLASFRSGGASVVDHAPSVDLAFIDGMHLFEFALRDLMNTERHARWWSVIVLDDMLPRNDAEASRDRTTSAWAGDVFKVLPVLAENRPDLIVLPIDTSPTGVAVVLGADASSDILRERHEALARTWATPDPQVVPPAIIRREGAYDPHGLLASPLWERLRTARSADLSRTEGLASIRDVLASVDGAGRAAAGPRT